MCIYIYIHKICEDKFGGFKKLFSWFGQKLNKKDQLCMATMPITPARTYLRDDAMSQQDIFTSFSIIIEFEATEYLYSIQYFIQYSIHILNF